MLFNARKHIVDLEAKHRLPPISMARESVELGGLMSYGASIVDLQRRAAAYVDNILNGGIELAALDRVSSFPGTRRKTLAMQQLFSGVQPTWR